MQDDNWYGPDVATLGDRLAAAREAQGLSQEDLAKKLGLKPKSVQHWEEDHSEPRANRLQMLAGVLNVSMMWLITGEGEGVNSPDEQAISPDVNALLLELRALRAQIVRRAEKMAQVEKRLRAKLQEEGQL
ncbi:helix-turn-helix domain-containing protein [Sagittula salina]|uniref:Helix-turn-helix transcriptional regulator n=1 Tax=Sagittula salina TaxID=2820268 RepID=A0A940S0Y9_9RHOB|nr:helix-turn-helix transcriptional regulator [Sagittula salina]MBP0483588.1 helix-turn-helix transcriptional regulator [Sagittula salina]